MDTLATPKWNKGGSVGKTGDGGKGWARTAKQVAGRKQSQRRKNLFSRND